MHSPEISSVVVVVVIEVVVVVVVVLVVVVKTKQFQNKVLKFFIVLWRYMVFRI